MRLPKMILLMSVLSSASQRAVGSGAFSEEDDLISNSNRNGLHLMKLIFTYEIIFSVE